MTSSTSDRDRPPTFSTEDAQDAATRIYGLEVRARPLPAYLDQNFRLENPAGERWVLKISYAKEDRRLLELQAHVMGRLAASDFDLATPSVCPTVGGETIHALRAADGTLHDIRLLTFVDGTPWSTCPPPDADRFEALGRRAGKLDRILEGLTHPAMHWRSSWDLRHTLDVRPLLPCLAGRRRRALAEQVLRHYEHAIAGHFEALPSSVIHGDINNDNLILDERDRIVGLVDFGDAIHTATVCEVAIAIAYAMLDRPAPIGAAGHILRGYHAIRRLDHRELEVVPGLVAARLLMSAAFSALHRSRGLDNDYVTSNEEAAWRLLEVLADGPTDWALHAVER